MGLTRDDRHSVAALCQPLAQSLAQTRVERLTELRRTVCRLRRRFRVLAPDVPIDDALERDKLGVNALQKIASSDSFQGDQEGRVQRDETHSIP